MAHGIVTCEVCSLAFESQVAHMVDKEMGMQGVQQGVKGPALLACCV